VNILQERKDLDNYFYVRYHLKSATTVQDAAFDLAVGQSIGNPNMRRSEEHTSELQSH